MSIDRKDLYRFPWSQTDNAGGWVEVTDMCNFSCPGCYRHKLEGHRPLEEIKKDILACQKLTNCDRMGIAGGEPLIYPHIVEVVDFIANHDMKPMLLTNGEKLSWNLANQLKNAGLAKFHFHVDSGMQRPGWIGKNEIEMNKLRQYYADFVWQLGGVQCGYNITIFPSSLEYLPEIIKWCQQNIHKVNHVSLVTFRSVPIHEDYEYQVNGIPIDPTKLQHSTDVLEDINLTAEKMFETIAQHIPNWKACVYLNGTAVPEVNKFIVTLNLGSKKKKYGVLGPKTVELAQVFYHLINGRYLEFTKSPVVGKKIFALSLFDKELRKTFRHYLKACFINPVRLFDKIYVQSISLQQPNELLNGHANMCGSCVNMMMYKGELINSCRLDEYRIFGGPIMMVPHSGSKSE